MAPRLALSQLEMTRDMIISQSRTTSQMAEVAGCSKRSITRCRSPDVWQCPSALDPRWPSTNRIHTWMRWRTSYEFELVVLSYTISRALRSHGWSKVARRIAQERNADPRDYYLYQLSNFRSYH
ncbi:uncharacterized protein N7500_008961 [Penicillium coprophilum]|uniref:uncharacterized protein n=1 Tax=Penicillium coprophilum TaxID=36646 RepID=UPI0023972815|nr:uncharacterized protein N7500_008961 [Penicillium coprophilum]KAJ5159310.1 hypothetical protein N7500_008961 [Penicillium coprophilum]